MKKSLSRHPLMPAMPLALVATKDEEKLNFATYGMWGQLSFEPPLLYISAQKDQLTAKIINKTKKFSVNIPNTQLLQEIKYCGSVSGAEKDKSRQFEVFYGKNNVPMITKCPVNMNCELAKTMEMGNTFVFIGRVIETFSEEDCLLHNLPEAAKVDPLILTLQGKFHRMGNEID
ncbi:MAG: flavin reductase family protein [Thermincola sp.]|jgi:flavin reductase (DIM6/NTAB) family NADH-FMN oxidoreductase RutF|nr:flavin reductase family protein [Thermincola sp.]MDT3702722.1 flavin reductase family protein [Thermincola sp.]